MMIDTITLKNELVLIDSLRNKVKKCKDVDSKSAQVFLEMLDNKADEINRTLCNI